MNTDKLVKKFSESQPTIKSASALSKNHPPPIIAPPSIDNLLIPTFAQRIDMSAPTTPANAIIELSPASSPPQSPPVLGPAPSCVRSHPGSIRNPFLNTVVCSSLTTSNLGELSRLALAGHGYFSHHGSLPQSLEDGALFHHINALNIYHFVQTNGQA